MNIIQPGDVIHLAFPGTGDRTQDTLNSKEISAWYHSHGIPDVHVTCGSQTTKPEVVAVIRKP